MADQPSVHIVAEEPRASFFSNVVAIIGFIILIVVVIWGLVHLASLSKGWLSGIFNKSAAPAIQVTAPAQVNSGDSFTVSWKYSTTDKGNYALLYKCTKGMSLKFADSADIPCGAAFTIGSVTSAKLSSKIAGTSTSILPLSVIFLPSATSSKQAQGSANITVHLTSFVPPKTTTPVTTPATTDPVETPVTTSKPASTSYYNGPADIAVRIIAIGVIDSQTGQFVNRPPQSPYEMVAAQFDIVNLGGSSSGTYYFSAVLPTETSYTYASSAQSSLAPGDHVVNTLRWNQSAQTGAFSVTVTSGGIDANNANNYASQWLGNNYYAPQGTYYPQYQY